MIYFPQNKSYDEIYFHFRTRLIKIEHEEIFTTHIYTVIP